MGGWGLGGRVGGWGDGGGVGWSGVVPSGGHPGGGNGPGWWLGARHGHDPGTLQHDPWSLLRGDWGVALWAVVAPGCARMQDAMLHGCRRKLSPAFDPQALAGQVAAQQWAMQQQQQLPGPLMLFPGLGRGPLFLLPPAHAAQGARRSATCGKQP